MFSSRKHLGLHPFAPAAPLLMVLMSCGSVPVHVKKTNPHTEPELAGAVYFLPKALLQVDFTLKLTARPTDQCGNPDSAGAYDLTESCKLQADASDITLEGLSVATLSVPDQDAAFTIETSGSFAVKTEFTASFNEQGELTSGSGTSTNQSLQFVTFGLQTAAKIIGAAKMAGRQAGPPALDRIARNKMALDNAIKNIDARLHTILAELAPTPGKPPKPAGSAQPRKIAELADETDKLLALRGKLVAQAAELEKSLTHEMVFPIRCIIEPPDNNDTFVINPDPASCALYGKVKETLTASSIGTPDELPELTVELKPVTGSDATKPTPPATVQAGFVYRLPAWYHVETDAQLKGKSIAHARTLLALPQRGRLAVLSIGEDDLRAGKTVMIELHPGLGSIKAVKLNGDPIAISDATQVVDAVKALGTAREDAALEKMKQETARLEAERAYLEAKQKLEAAKTGSAGEE